jgi:peptide/nickel transport system substrate-binding protein
MKAASPSGALTHTRRRPGMRSRAALTILLAAVASASAGCSSAPTAQGPGAGAAIPLLREGTTYTFSNINEKYADGLPEANWSEHLVRLGPQEQVEPWLAQSVSQQSPTVYVYHLRHGVHFWDGNEMTSADVVSSLDFARQPDSYMATDFTNVASITASGRYTVVITLKRPDAGWPPVLATIGGISEKKFLQAHGASVGKPGVGLMDTGPFEIQSFDPTTGVELTANPHYWGGPVPVKHISVKFFKDDTPLALAMRAGEIDIAYPQSTNSFQSTCGCKVTSAPGDTSADVVMNVNIAPFNNIHVRRAVAYAIDRPAEVAASSDPSTPDTSNSVLTPGELGTLASPVQVTALLKSLPNYPYNLAKAKAELAQSPYPHGFTTTAYTLDFGTYLPETEVVAAQLAKIGINVQLKVMSLQAWVAKYEGPKTAAFWVITNAAGGFPDPARDAQNMVDGGYATASGGNNLAGYNSPQVNSLLTQADSIQNKAQRFALYGQVLKIVANDVPYVMLYTHTDDLALSSKFTWPGYYYGTYSYPWAFNIRLSH